MSHRFPIIDLEGPSQVDLTLEERYQTLAAVFTHQFFQLYRLVGKKYGWEAANDLAAEVPASSVPLIVEGYRRRFGLEGEGAELLAKVMQAEFQAEGSDVAVEHEDADAAAFEVLCSFGDMLQGERYADVEIADGLCHRGCAQWMNEVGATLDPPVAAERQTWMGDGAPRCRYALTRQAGAGA
jgi:hypothetical protein